MMITALLKRDVLLLMRQRAELLQIWAMPALYACLAGFLDAARSVPAALLLVILMLWPIYMLVNRAWADDARSGFLDQAVVGGVPLSLVAGVRILVLAECALLPAALVTMAVMMVANAAAFSWHDALAILLASYTLAALVSVVAALTVSLRVAGGVALLLLFPLLLPTLILLTVALTEPTAAVAALYLLAALAVVAIPLGAIATATGLRHHVCQ